MLLGILSALRLADAVRFPPEAPPLVKATVVRLSAIAPPAVRETWATEKFARGAFGPRGLLCPCVDRQQPWSYLGPSARVSVKKAVPGS